MRKTTIALAAVTALLALAACSPSGDDSIKKDQAATNQQLDRYQANQPVPAFDWSQYRQTVIDVETAQVHGVATTTFFFNLGVARPIKVCPSIGFPVASTAQLTNPQQLAARGYNGGTIDGVVGQQEPNGVYTGDSSGTYVVCVAPNGTRYVTYWEGDVHTEGGPAHWDDGKGQIVLDGAPTVVSKSQK